MALTQVNLGMLDDTGRLGLGTSPPTSSHRIALDNDSNYGGIEFKQSGARIGQIIQDGVGNLFVDANSNNAGGSLQLRNNYSTSLKIDSAGRVTTPNQPSFHAYSNANLNHGTTDTKYVWNLTRHNIGSHYDTSNGRFTAPIDGRYYFNVSALQNVGPTSYYTRVWLYKNGSVFLDGLNTQALQSGYGRLDIDAVVEASAGDYFETYFVSNNGSAFVYATYSWFSGHLLG